MVKILKVKVKILNSYVNDINIQFTCRCKPYQKVRGNSDE